MACDLGESGVGDRVAAVEREAREVRKVRRDERDVEIGRGRVGEVEVREQRVASAERLERRPKGVRTQRDLGDGELSSALSPAVDELCSCLSMGLGRRRCSCRVR